MTVVIADTSPRNYLILIGDMDVLHQLYSSIIIPVEVLHELTAAGAPPPVASWIRNKPGWIEVRTASAGVRPHLSVDLDSGELAAILLALHEPDALLLIDEAAGRNAASGLGLANTGTLGVLVAAGGAGQWPVRTTAAEARREAALKS